MRRAALMLILPILLACAPSMARANDAEPAARLAATVGTVEYLGPETDRFEPAPVNLALQPGDRLRTGPESRTELQFEGGAIVRLGAGSEADVLAVGRSPVVRLVAGRAYGKGPRVPSESLTVEAGLRTVGAAEGSAFRVETAPTEPRGEVAATAGRVAVETEGERVEMAHGLRLPAGERTAATGAVLARDDFDRWNAERDAVLARAAVGRYAPAYLPGLADLDAAGTWVRTDDYGYAWRPYVAAGWRPFAHGRWVLRPYYGWVWLAAEPWGYTTYHYGRWVPSGVYGWIWIPGPRFTVGIGVPYAPLPPVVVAPRPVIIVPRPVHVRPPVVVRPPTVIERPILAPPRPHRQPVLIERPVGPPSQPRRQPMVVERPARAPEPRGDFRAPRGDGAPRSGGAVVVAPPARPAAPAAPVHRRQPLPAGRIANQAAGLLR